MVPESIYKRFVEEFPHMEGQVLKYYIYRKEPNTIKIWLKNHNKLFFSILDDGTWHLRTEK